MGADKTLVDIYKTLYELIGLHRQLLDIVRLEKESLIGVDLKAVQKTTYAKEAVIGQIQQAESQRMRLIAHLSAAWKTPVAELTLEKIVHEVQAGDLKQADQFRSALNTLTLLVQRVSAQNKDNKALVERSLEHISRMKSNVLGEASPHSNAYGKRGEKVNTAKGARLISKEV